MKRLLVLNVLLFVFAVAKSQISVSITSQNTYNCPFGTDSLIIQFEGGSPPYSFELLNDTTQAGTQYLSINNTIKVEVNLTEGRSYSINSVSDKLLQSQPVDATISLNLIPTPTVNFSSSVFYYNRGEELTVTLEASSFSGNSTIKIEGPESTTFQIDEKQGFASFTNVYFSDKSFRVIEVSDFGCVFPINDAVVTSVEKAADPCLKVDTTQDFTIYNFCEGDEIRFQFSNWEADNIFRIEGLPQNEIYTHSSFSDFGILNQSLPAGDYNLTIYLRKNETCASEFQLDKQVNFSVFKKPIDTLNFVVNDPTCANGLTSLFTIENTEVDYSYRTILNGFDIQDKISLGGDLTFTLTNFNVFSENSVNVNVSNQECSVNLRNSFFYNEINSFASTNLQDSLALVALYDSLDGNNWINATNWKSESALSTWTGVVMACGRVIELNLSNMALKGRLPNNIGVLTKLKKLDLTSDTILGPLPSSFANLTELEELYLAFNKLQGPFPSVITNLNALSNLDLSGNQLKGKVPQSISNLVNLNSLNLSDNYFTDTLPSLDFMSGFAPLVNISFNKFTFISMIPNYQIQNWESFNAYYQAEISDNVDTTVKEGSTLTLTISEPKVNDTKYQWYESLGEGYRELQGDTFPSLTFLKIKASDESSYYCRLTHPNLEGIELYSGYFNVRICKKPTVKDSLKLVSIYNATGGVAWKNKTKWLTDAPVDEWFGVKTDCDQIVEINLPNNNLIDSLPAEIDSLYYLQKLDLSGNKLNNKNLSNILISKSELKYLDLSKNKFSGRFPQVFTKGAQIEHLNLSTNDLSDSIPDVFEGFYKIKYFNIDSNRFVGPLPASIAQDSLEELYLGNNQFTDTLSSRLFLAKRLKIFDANSNNIFGAIPSNISAWDSVRIINLSNNKLTGTLTNGFWQLNKLERLNLSSNNLSDTINSEIFKLVSLKELNLENNSFSGKLAPAIGLLKTLETLIISKNNFSGSIPLTLGNLQKLITFEGATNQISGKIPASLGTIASLESVNLGNNFLEDSLPNSFINLSKLRTLELFNNKLTYIPTLKSINSLSTLNVASNRLTFEHLVPNIGISKFQYSPQDSVYKKEVIKISNNQPLYLLSIINGANNQYQWYKNGSLLNAANSSAYFKSIATKADTGTYSCNITNPSLPLLTLYRRPLKVIACDPAIPTPIIRVVDSSACLSKTLLGPSGYQKYEWFLDSYKLSGATDSMFLVVQNGSYRLAIEDNTECKAFSGVKAINVFGTLSIPQIDQSKLQSNKTLSSNASYPIYQWYVNGKLIVGAKTQTLPIYYNGNYSLEVSSLDSCKLNSKEVIVSLNGLPAIAKTDFYVEDAKEITIPVAGSSAKISPNPSSGTVSINLPKGQTFAELIISDISGRQLKTIFIGENTTVLDTNLNAGIYIFKIIIGGNTQWEKIVIE